MPTSKPATVASLTSVALGLALALAAGCDLPDPIDQGGDTSADTDGLDAPPPPPGDSGGSGGEEPPPPPPPPGDTYTDTGDTGDTGGDTAGVDDDVLDLPSPPYSYNDALPQHFRTPAVRGFDNTPQDNPITDAGATLGRVLFYDTALSKNETVACASFHQQAAGFSDNAALSKGFDGELTGRNSMGLSNARWYASGRFFWDERAATLEEQVLGPIQSEVEMGLTLDELIERVSTRPYYDALFIDAFGDDEVTTDRIASALAQFVRAMASYRSRYDAEIAQAPSIAADFAGFSPAENQGKAIFLGPRGGCAACHLAGPPPQPGGVFANEAIFQPVEPINNGLDAGPVEDDNGVGDISGDPQDNGLFKSSSLRNIALSAPYMHDGRFDTLAEVVDFYNNGVQNHPNLDPRLRGPDQQPRRLNLTGQEKAALVAFLGTLTDDALINDPRFADPFKH